MVPKEVPHVSVRGEVGKEAGSGRLPRTVQQVVALVLVLGGLSAIVVWRLTPFLTSPAGVPESTGTWLSENLGYGALIVLLAAAGELVSVRVRRGDQSEDLTFLEVVLVVAVLTMPPLSVLAAMLLGLLLASVIQRRDWSKTLFNLGSYATSTSALIIIYYLLDDGEDRFGWESVLALIAASVVFSIINVVLLSLVFHVVVGAAPREYITDGWRLSASMALGGVGVGTTAVFLADSGGWPLLPFVALPLLALWYAYGAEAAHVEARERNRWLVTLGGALAQHGRGSAPLAESAEAIRQIVGAPELLILDPNASDLDERTEAILASTWADQGPRALAPEELPAGWWTGVVTRLDLGSANPGALLLGSDVPYRLSRIAGRTRGWSLAEADAPVLGALVAAVGSAMRAGAAFDALTEETAKLTAVVDNTSDGIAMVDDSGRVRLWSQTMARMTGVDAGRLDQDLDSAPEVVRTLVAAAREGRTHADGTPAPVQVHLVRDDGEQLDVSVSTVRIREASASAHSDESGWVSILTVHDETRERRVERMKTDFVATISHELRTPITPIKGYAHLLATRADRVTPEKRAQALRVISDRADHLSRLVDDLLLASQASEGARLAVELGIEDLGEVVEQAVTSFPQMSRRISVTLPSEPVLVQCDRIRAVQCLANLIGNAEKYAPAGSPVEIRVSVSGLQAHVHVRDHGPGIPDQEHDKVFERFYRREDPFTMRTGGAGLGLHIARELAVAMGGGLTLRNPAEGSGAEFVLHLLTSEAPAVGSTQVASPLGGRGAPRPASPATEQGPDGTMDPADRQAAM
jgi:signal transduction histidine kinase